jgi:hypothetical protein
LARAPRRSPRRHRAKADSQCQFWNDCRAIPHGFDWIAHIDSDELLYAQNDIGTVLTGCSANVVRFAMKVAVRPNSNIELMGIHGPQRPKRMPELRTEQIALLH